MQPFRLTATEAVARFNAESLTVEEYARSLLSRIQERDSQVQAWAYLDPDYVIEQAKDLDKIPVEKRGPLHGVSVAVKDIIYTKRERRKEKVQGEVLTARKACQLSTTLPYMTRVSPRSMQDPLPF